MSRTGDDDDPTSRLAQLNLGQDGAGDASARADDDLLDDWDADLDATLQHVEAGVKDVPAAAAPAPAPSTSLRHEASTTGQGGEEDGEEPAPRVVAVDDLPFCGAHIVEVHGLTKADGQEQLEQLAEQLCCRVSPNIRWVDERHALLVFADPHAAREALQDWPANSRYKARTFVEACATSKGMPESALQPAKPRPRTTTAVARRLIGSALNMSGALRDRDAERDLATQRRQQQEARKAQQQARAQAAAIWGDER